jgi:predicted nucleotidyltransferase
MKAVILAGGLGTRTSEETNPMRLSTEHRHLISRTIARRDPAAAVYLFGSRTDMHQLGGDIDLLVLSQTLDIMDKLDILADLHRALGEQKIDLIICPDPTQPFAQLALAEGIRLS